MALTKVDAQLLNGAVTADSSGNVGIGTSSPSTKLSVVTGTDNANALALQGDTANNVMTLTNYQMTVGRESGSNGGLTIGTKSQTWGATGGFTAISTNGTERMRIDSSGNVLIGGTTANGANTITIEYNSNCPSINFNTGFNGRNSQIFKYNSSQVGSIVTNSGSVSFNTTSDYRLKDNIAPMTGALDKVIKLKPCTYIWKATGDSSEGFIAHELQAVVPEAVTGEKDAVNEDGSIKPQGIDTSFLVATLTAAIQELKAELDATKAEVAALKTGA